MLKVASYLVVGLAVGFAVATWSGRGARIGVGDTVEELAGERRLSALEGALELERRNRLALEDQVRILEEGLAALETAYAEVDAAGGGSEPDTGVAEDAGAPLEVLTERFPQPVRERLGAVFRTRGNPEERAALFVEAGFSPERAQWIVERTEALRMETLQARYDAARGGEPVAPGTIVSPEQALRAELGDDDYERYLSALGRPSTVAVGSVLGNSPAAAAGLLPGDEITAYSGERVFDMTDLNRLTYEGEPGEPVAIDIVRDGQPMQIYVPRGPIGITGGGRFGVRGQ